MDVSNFVLLHLLKDQPGLKVSPSHSQEEEVPPGVFCLFVLWFWFGVSLKQGPVLSQGELSAAHRVVLVGGREQPLSLPKLTKGYSEGRAGGLEGSKDPN